MGMSDCTGFREESGEVHRLRGPDARGLARGIGLTYARLCSGRGFRGG